MNDNKRAGWPPLVHFALMALLALALSGYFIHEFSSRGFSWKLALLLSMTLFVAMSSVTNLRRFRLAPAGIVIQHVLTRRTIIIPYASIEKIITTHTFKGRAQPAWQILRIQHRGRWDELRFFDRIKRDDFLRQLDSHRQEAAQPASPPPAIPGSECNIQETSLAPRISSDSKRKT